MMNNSIALGTMKWRFGNPEFPQALPVVPVSARFAAPIGIPKTEAETENRFYLRTKLGKEDKARLEAILAANPEIDCRVTIGRVTLTETEIFLSFNY